MFKFEIIKTSENSLARNGIFKTPHGEIKTPNFMAVGTKGSVKTLSSEDLKSLNAEVILANTYHLYLRPGEELVKEQGRLHKWMNWDKPILTDSGGFQVFSLAKEKNFGKKTGHAAKVKITENGVEFSSHLDGSKHFFTPEKAIEIQHDLGADIIMAFDECAPAESSKSYFKAAMQRTHNWAERCKKHHLKLLSQQNHQQALFPIVQGGLHEDLRIESAKFINDLDLAGNAIGGLSVGESAAVMYKNIEHTVPHLTREKPVYLMGVGKPENLFEAIDRGIDLFDCVHPTRIARHGNFWTENGLHNIKNAKYKNDSSPLSKKTHKNCTNYSKSYIRHLFIEKEILALRLLTLHNLDFLLKTMSKIRKSIREGNFKNYKKNFLEKFLSNE